MIYRKSFRKPHGTADIRPSDTGKRMGEDARLTIFQPVALSGVANEFSVLVVLHGHHSAIEIQVVPLPGRDSSGVRVQAKAISVWFSNDSSAGCSNRAHKSEDPLTRRHCSAVNCGSRLPASLTMFSGYRPKSEGIGEDISECRLPSARSSSQMGSAYQPKAWSNRREAHHLASSESSMGSHQSLFWKHEDKLSVRRTRSICF